MLYKELQQKLRSLVKEFELSSEPITIKTRILNSKEAIGTPERNDFPLLKGKESLIEAYFKNAKGQAYTDSPSIFIGKLNDIFSLPLNTSKNRAIFISSLNAVLRYLYPDLTTIHCKDKDPEICAEKIVAFLKNKYGHKLSLGLIGLQPAILEALVKAFNSNVFCLDKDEENINRIKYNVYINYGSRENIKDLFKRVDVVLATGSTIVNGSIIDILNFAQKYNRLLYFYGTTIAGAAKLIGLNRLCFMSS